MSETPPSNSADPSERVSRRWATPAAVLAGLATLVMFVLTLVPIVVPDRKQQMLAEIDALWLQKKWAEAEQLCRSRLEEYPDSADLALRLGNCLSMQQRYAQARAVFDAALAKHPSNPYLARDRALLEYRAGNFDEALQRLQEVAKKATYMPIVNYYIGRIYERKGMYDKALEAYVAELNVGTSPAAWTRYLLLKKVYRAGIQPRGMRSDRAAEKENMVESGKVPAESDPGS